MAELRACGGEVSAADEGERAGWARRLQDVAYEASDAAGRAELYRQAIAVAEEFGQPALGVRLSLVRFLLDTGDPAAAVAELHACEGDVPGAAEDDRVWWAELREEASHAA